MFSSAVVISNTLCLMFSVICVFLVSRQRESKQQQLTLMVCILGSFISFGYWFLIQAENVEAAIIAQKVIYIGTSNILYFMIRFTAEHTGFKIPKAVEYLFVSLNLIILALALTFDKHTLFYKSYEYKIENGLPFFEKVSGPGSILFIVLMAVYLILGLLMTVKNLSHGKSKRSRKISKMLFITILVPCAAYTAEKLFRLPVYLMPYGLLFGEIFALRLVYGMAIYDFNNTAQELAYDAIDDAVLAIDNVYRFKGCNSKAKELFPCLKDISIDDGLDSLDTNLFEILVNHNMNDITVNRKVYRPEIRNIQQKNKVMGMVVWFYDVTAEIEKTDLLENYRKDLEREVEIQTEKLRDVQKKVIMGFANIIENRDNVTGGHIKRTSMYIDILIKGLVSENAYTDILTPSYISHIKLAAPLHDIGKIAVSDNILNKKGRFTYEEFEIMKSHTTLGAKIIEETLSGLDDLEYYKLARELALYHHEKWDGTGYPEGISNISIPLCARIMAVVDVFDALVSERPYKQSYPVSTVYKIIENESGKQFDPLLVRCFVKVRPEIERVVAETKGEVKIEDKETNEDKTGIN